jgi:prepilin-type N-terminal cleavage/methylation domain-containing protein
MHKYDPLKITKKILIGFSRLFRPHYFTLIELLVVVAILAILISILTPALTRVVYKSKVTQCGMNLKQLGLVISIYTDDNNSNYPSVQKHSLPNIIGRNNSYTLGYHGGSTMKPLLETVMKDLYQVLTCPTAPRKTKNNESCYSLWFDVNGRGAIGTNRNDMMMREGDMYRLNEIKNSANQNMLSNIIAHDRTQRRTINNLNDGCPANRRLLTNHFQPGSYKEVMGGIVYRGYQAGDSNYLLDDGSVYPFFLIPLINPNYGASSVLNFKNTKGDYEESYLPLDLLIDP